MSDNTTCFEPQVFTRFLEERSQAGEETQILSHIVGCERCRLMLEQLAGHPAIWSDIQEHLAEHDLDEPNQTLSRHQRELSTVRNLIGPSEDPNMLGRLGSYEVCGIIGRGSAGIVVKALDTRLNRYVAIKLLAPAYSNHGCSRRRFERECKAIASVKNQHVVEIHTVEEFNGTPYIVMPYVPNGSLQKRVEQSGPLTVNEVVCVGMQIADGLSAAHQRGIVHRDVKPANVLLENGIEGAMVSDFGLARVVDEATMTYSGTISGTPQYMSPEQAKGERVDQRSDLFSLGSTLYMTCTGHAPFTSESVFGIIKKVCDTQPKPIREINPDIPTWLVAFIEKLHAKDPDDRFESAQQVAELLAQELAYLQSPTLVARPARHWWTRSVLPPAAYKQIEKTRSHSAWMIAAGILFTAIISGLIGSTIFGGGRNNIGSHSVVASSEANPGTNPEMLVFIRQENEKLPRFSNDVEKIIEVQPAGNLWFNSNLGSVEIDVHNEPTVKMTAQHSVAARNQEEAKELLQAVKFTFEPDDTNPLHESFERGRDAIISTSFPTQSRMTEQEIRAFDDLDELKKQLLLRNHNSFRKVKFKLLVPQSFNLNVNTGSGAITVASFDGDLVARTRGGQISTDDLTGSVDLQTYGGPIKIGDAENSVELVTHGGHIDCGDLDAGLNAMTHGGMIYVSSIRGPAKLKSHGGGITIRKASSLVDAVTHAGDVTVNFVDQPGEDCRIESHAGSLQIGLVDGLSFDIHARCDLGKVSGPFVEKKAKQIQHRLNDGKVGLKATSYVGSIKFKQINEDDIPENMRPDARVVDPGRVAFNTAYNLHMDGRIDEAIVAHRKAAEFPEYKGIATYNLGCAWALKGDLDKAFDALNSAIDHGFDDRHQFRTDSDLDALRDDPRFDEIMERLNESQSYSTSHGGDCNECEMKTRSPRSVVAKKLL